MLATPGLANVNVGFFLVESSSPDFGDQMYLSASDFVACNWIDDPEQIATGVPAKAFPAADSNRESVIRYFITMFNSFL